MDFTILTNDILSAQALHASAVEGLLIGQYAVGSKATFQTAINAATAVKNNPASTQAHINQAVTTLAQATTTFSAAKISLNAASNVSGNSVDLDPIWYSGVKSTITWTDSTTSGNLTYTVKRNTTNSLVGAVSLASNIPVGTQTYSDNINQSGSGKQYYYFIEVTDGTNIVATDGFSLPAVQDLKNGVALNYRSSNVDSLVYDPTSDFLV